MLTKLTPRWLNLICRLALAAGLALGALPLGQPAQAAPAMQAPAAPTAALTVNTLVDEYNTGTNCSLREAIQAANTNSAFGGCTAGSGTDTITLVACCTYVLDRTGASEDGNSTGDLDILSPLTLIGQFGDLRTISQTVSDRVIHISTTTNVRLDGLIIAGGVLTSGVGGGVYNNGGRLVLDQSTLTNNQATAGEGGGLYNTGVLTITYSTIVSNSASSAGGGLSNTGTLSITSAAIVSNTAPAAGGLRHATGVAHLVNVTVSGNRATAGSAGGLHNASGTTNLYNVTVYSNSASVSGGGVFNTGVFNFHASIIAGNAAPGSPNCAGTLTSQNYNLVQSTSGCTLAGTLTNVITGTSPLLSPLALNSEFYLATINHRPILGSPVIDAGPPGGCTNEVSGALDTDQRSTQRPDDGNGDGSSVCDLGSVEYRPGQVDLGGTIEIDEDAGQILTDVDRQSGNDGVLTVTVILTSGTALAGADFVGTPITVTIGDRQSDSLPFAIGLLDDDDPEGPEQFVIGMANPAGGATISNEPTRLVTIIDDENPGQLVLGAERLVTREGEGALVATVARIVGNSGAVGVSYQTQGGSAAAGADFAATSGTLTWPDGDATPRTFTVPITDDGSLEAAEVFTLTLFNPTGLATLEYSTTVVTLLDNDATGQTINVTVASDDLSNNGNCTLREAVRAANLNQAVDACPAGTGADTIALAPLTYTLSLVGTGEDAALTGDLDITEDLTIRGAGASVSAINGAQIDRVLHVAPNLELVQLILEDLTIRGGVPGAFEPGGGAHNLGALILRDVTFRDNVAYDGGGLWSQGDLIASNATFENNQVSSDGGGLFLDGPSASALEGLQVISNTTEGAGGGLYMSGSATLSQSTVERNTATDFGDGGGLSVEDGQVVLVDVNVRQNQADDEGGGLYIYGYWLIMSGGEIAENAASAGGGLLTLADPATVLAGVTITNNTASDGGGIYLQDPYHLTVVDSLIANNEAGNGGGIYLDDGRAWLAGTAVRDNTATGQGGGLYSLEGRLFAARVSVTGNEASNGGGLYAEALANLRLLNMTVAGNTATGQGGGLVNDGRVDATHVSVAGNNAALGAGLYNNPAFTPTLRLLNSLLADNPGGNCAGDDPTSLGHNLSSDLTCGLSVTGDLDNVAANLDTLALHGGPTLVQGLLNTSPAIDAADDAACPAVDQRGLPRPVDGDDDTTAACDIGAFEWQVLVLKLFLPLISK